MDQIDTAILRAAPPATLSVPILRLASRKGVELRTAAEGGMPTMVGYFSTFGDWYEIDSWWEGQFLESIRHGAFAKTISESRDQMKVLFDHGMDFSVGNKVLGPIDDLREDNVGPWYEVPLLDTSYNRDLVPGLDAGLYGASFRFQVIKDVWDLEPEPSDANPRGIPERTITEARVFEFGPVTFPANAKATAGTRSLTDRFYEHLRSRSPETFEELARSMTTSRTPSRDEHSEPQLSTDEPLSSSTRAAAHGRPERALALNLKRAKESSRWTP